LALRLADHSAGGAEFLTVPGWLQRVVLRTRVSGVVAAVPVRVGHQTRGAVNASMCSSTTSSLSTVRLLRAANLPGTAVFRPGRVSGNIRIFFVQQVALTHT
jgi:hypothetical protein